MIICPGGQRACIVIQIKYTTYKSSSVTIIKNKLIFYILEMLGAAVDKNVSYIF